MKTLIIGYGEVGRALEEVLYQYRPDIIDLTGSPSIDNTYEIIQICFPYSSNFITDVQAYQTKYLPKYTVIHSTVPVGTSQRLNAIHSPIRGLHPELAKGIKTFVKYLGGEQASELADYFRRAGLRVCLFDKSETTEALKLWDTQQYLESIRVCQEIKQYCEDHSLNFHEVYTLANQTYNEGYEKLGHSEYIRPILQPIMTDIGGHCLTPNEKLLYGTGTTN